MAAIYEDGKLTLSGFVGDDMFGDGFTYAQVLTALAGADGDLVVHINSGGGFASEGSAIYALLASRAGRTDVVVDGIAASAASLIAMAGETVSMSLGSILMIHDPATITFGTSADHQKTVVELEALATTYARVYAEKTGGTVEEMRSVMQAETWLTPEQAVERGFADAIGQQQAETVAAMDYRAYAHAPKQLVTAAVDNDWLAPRKTAAASAAATQKHDLGLPQRIRGVDGRDIGARHAVAVGIGADRHAAIADLQMLIGRGHAGAHSKFGRVAGIVA